MEPLLGAVDLTRISYHTTGEEGDGNRWTLNLNALSGFRATSMCGGIDGRKIDWVIVGGESGRGARSMVLGWAKDIVRQCQAAGTPVMVKQLGAKPTNREGVIHVIHDKKGADMADWPEVLRVREFPK
jgi:hypothetical protein